MRNHDARGAVEPHEHWSTWTGQGGEALDAQEGLVKRLMAWLLK